VYFVGLYCIDIFILKYVALGISIIESFVQLCLKRSENNSNVLIITCNMSGVSLLLRCRWRFARMKCVRSQFVHIVNNSDASRSVSVVWEVVFKF
jgi:hypothetical protein